MHAPNASPSANLSAIGERDAIRSQNCMQATGVYNYLHSPAVSHAAPALLCHGFFVLTERGVRPRLAGGWKAAGAWRKFHYFTAREGSSEQRGVEATRTPCRVSTSVRHLGGIEECAHPHTQMELEAVLEAELSAVVCRLSAGVRGRAAATRARDAHVPQHPWFLA